MSLISALLPDAATPRFSPEVVAQTLPVQPPSPPPLTPSPLFHSLPPQPAAAPPTPPSLPHSPHSLPTAPPPALPTLPPATPEVQRQSPQSLSGVVKYFARRRRLPPRAIPSTVALPHNPVPTAIPPSASASALPAPRGPSPRALSSTAPTLNPVPTAIPPSAYAPALPAPRGPPPRALASWPAPPPYPGPVGIPQSASAAALPAPPSALGIAAAAVVTTALGAACAGWVLVAASQSAATAAPVGVYSPPSCAGQSLVSCFAAVFVSALADTLAAALVAARGSMSASTVGAALGWLWQIGGFAWMVLVTGEGDGWRSGWLRRQPGAGAAEYVQQEDESLTRGRARGIWARWSRVRCHVSRREWKRLCRCARGNTMVVVQEYTFMWNTRGLRANLGLVRDGRWNLMDHEAQQEHRASQRKIEWLREHVYSAEPTVVFLEEVTGNFHDAKKGLRLTFARLGYTTLMLPGAGGGAGSELSQANGIFVAVRKLRAVFVGGAIRVASRCMGVQIKHTQEPGKVVRSYVCRHGLHPRPKGGEQFQSQLRDSMEWLEQRGGGLLLGDFIRVVCCRWQASGGSETESS